jgi:colicin import membrane protein
LPEKQPDIALQREKEKQEAAERRREQLEEQKKAEAARLKREELEREKKLEARQKEEQLKREQLAQQKAQEEKERKKKEELAKAKAKQEEARLAALRQENLRRMQGLATAAGAPDSQGTAERASGPSTSYAGRIRARVKPNIAFTDDLPGNPTAEVEVRMAPDGTITSRRLTKPSGVGSWDQAVLRALDRTQVLPRDVDGRVHTPLLIEFRYKD